MSELSALPNIGKELERQLISVGIETVEELKKVGAEDAWLRIRLIDSSACINRLLGIEGAIQGIKKTLLPDQRKEELRAFYRRQEKPIFGKRAAEKGTADEGK